MPKDKAAEAAMVVAHQLIAENSYPDDSEMDSTTFFADADDQVQELYAAMDEGRDLKEDVTELAATALRWLSSLIG